MILQLSLHGSRVGRSGKLWETPSSQPEDQTIPATTRVMSQPHTSQSWYQICHTSAMFQKFHPCPQTNKCSLLKALPYTQSIHLRFFFSRVSIRERQFPQWPAGGATRKGQCEKGLVLHKPQVRTWGRTYPLCPAQVLFGLQSTIGL